MSYRCQICAKGIQYGHNVSHSKRRTRKIWKPNLQRVTVNGQKMRICTKCLKRLKKDGKVIFGRQKDQKKALKWFG